MTRVFICVTLALAQAAIAAASDHQQVSSNVVLQEADAMPDSAPAEDSCFDCDATKDADDYDDGRSDDDDLKDVIKDTLEDAFEAVVERYVDEEAVEQWADETASSFQEMQQRQQQETAEWAENVAK